MYEAPLTTSEAPPVPARKKGFWYWSIWVSFAGILLPLGICGWLGKRAMQDVARLTNAAHDPTSDAYLAALHSGLGKAMAYLNSGTAISAMALFWLTVSLISYLRLPKTLE